jgi:predicted lipid-binding transport protein (Tim44 family)
VPVLRHPGTGEVINVPEGEVGHAVIQGYQPVSLQEAAQTTAAAAPSDQSGIVGGINSLATGALSGLTLGASDVALAGLLDPGQLERLSSARSQHGTLGTAGQIAGAIAPSLLGAAPGSLLARSPPGSRAESAAALPTWGRGPAR